MAIEVILPKVDMVMESGTFVEWLKKDGDHIHKGDALFVITTDKAAIEVESPAEGILAGAAAKADDVIPVTQVMAYILAPGEALPDKAPPQPPDVLPTSFAVDISAAAQPALIAGAASVEGKVRATPLARRMAKSLQMDLSHISGRGPRGRIHAADIDAFQNSKPASEAMSVPASGQVQKAAMTSTSPTAIALPDARRKQVVPLAGARKIIAERIAYSAFTAPHIHLSLRVDMSEVVRLRERVMEALEVQTGRRVSITAILARAVAAVLPRHPYLNASLADGNIILWEDIHLGIATNVEENLIVPVIRGAQDRNLGQIVTALAELGEKARNRRLTPAEMMGSTFTISNLGMYGIESFTAIINPPESAILAVGKMVDTPLKNGDGFEFRPMLQLTVSADHRVVDGVAVARFLDDLKSTLENPYLLI